MLYIVAFFGFLIGLSGTLYKKTVDEDKKGRFGLPSLTLPGWIISALLVLSLIASLIAVNITTRDTTAKEQASAKREQDLKDNVSDLKGTLSDTNKKLSDTKDQLIKAQADTYQALTNGFAGNLESFGTLVGRQKALTSKIEEGFDRSTNQLGSRLWYHIHIDIPGEQPLLSELATEETAELQRTHQDSVPVEFEGLPFGLLGEQGDMLVNLFHGLEKIEVILAEHFNINDVRTGEEKGDLIIGPPDTFPSGTSPLKVSFRTDRHFHIDVECEQAILISVTDGIRSVPDLARSYFIVKIPAQGLKMSVQASLGKPDSFNVIDIAWVTHLETMSSEVPFTVFIGKRKR